MTAVKPLTRAPKDRNDDPADSTTHSFWREGKHHVRIELGVNCVANQVDGDEHFFCITPFTNICTGLV